MFYYQNFIHKMASSLKPHRWEFTSESNRHAYDYIIYSNLQEVKLLKFKLLIIS